MNPARIAVAALAALFAGIGLGFLFAPEQTAQAFQLEALGVSGLVAVRAELGGLFIGLATLCATAVVMRRRGVAMSAAVIISAIVAGRLVGIIAGGGASNELAMLAIEVIAIGALVFDARSIGKNAPAPRPNTRRLAIAGGVAAVAVAAIGAAALNPAVELKIFEGAAATVTARVNTALLEDDALRVAICGSSAPLPSSSRAKACAAVFAGGKYYLVDVGPESVENLVEWGIPLSAIGGVLLTHFHSDHIGDLGELNLQTWANGRQQPLQVYGGPGIDRVVDGFNAAYKIDQGYRTTHHTAQLMSPESWPMEAKTVTLDGPETPALSRTGIVLNTGDLKITAIEVDHNPVKPAYAYRFDYKGRSVVVTGDLKFHPPLADGAKNADILVSEAISRSMVKALQDGATAANRPRTATIMHDIQDYHISPTEAGEIANRAGVKLLVFYHLLPTPDNFIARRLFAADMSQVRNHDWVIADDGSLYTLPIGSTAIRIGTVAR